MPFRLVRLAFIDDCPDLVNTVRGKVLPILEHRGYRRFLKGFAAADRRWAGLNTDRLAFRLPGHCTNLPVKGKAQRTGISDHWKIAKPTMLR